MSSQPDSLPMMSSQPPAAAAPSGESNPIRDAISEAISEHKVILFMKGTPDAPACGFSARTVAVLQSLEAPLRPSTCCLTRASARSSLRSQTGRRSPSCSSTASSSGAVTS